MAEQERQILRYPYEALTDQTDYLQIDIVAYQSVKERTGNLVSGGSNRTISSDNIRLGKIKSENLSKVTLKENHGTIFLPIPSNIQDGNSVTYAEDSMNGIAAAAIEPIRDMTTAQAKDQLTGGISKLIDLAADPAVKTTLLRNLAAEAINIFGGNITPNQLLAREQGEIFNPNMELLFNGVTLRSFKFSFKLTPREEKEAEQIMAIIRSLKKNMAPKAGSNVNKYFLKSPNVFELRYKSGINEHPFLHSFKQCALTDMSVNYTGENVYATYGGDLKSPVSMIMDLTFKELEPIYYEDYNSGTNVGY